MRMATRFVWTGVVLGLLAGAPVLQIIADDAEAETKVARKVDDSTRLSSSADKHALLPALEAARGSLESLKTVKDYTAVFSKNEYVKDRLIRTQMEMKFREEPFSVYLKFLDLHAGREVIYVDGKNKGKFLVHEDGIKALIGTLQFLPTSADALEENRYPITKAGMRNMVETVIDQWEQELKHGETEVRNYPNAKVGDVECRMIEASHPQKRSHFKFQKTCLYIDKKTNLPIRVEQYGFLTAAGQTAPLHEEYTYSKLRINVGLTDRDFDPKNKDYKF